MAIEESGYRKQTMFTLLYVTKEWPRSFIFKYIFPYHTFIQILAQLLKNTFANQGQDRNKSVIRENDVCCIRYAVDKFKPIMRMGHVCYWKIKFDL